MDPLSLPSEDSCSSVVKLLETMEPGGSAVLQSTSIQNHGGFLLHRPIHNMHEIHVTYSNKLNKNQYKHFYDFLVLQH